MRGKKRCQMGVQPSVTHSEDNGKRQNECRGNEKGRWNKWDKTAQDGLKKKGKRQTGLEGVRFRGGYRTHRPETYRQEGRRKREAKSLGRDWHRHRKERHGRLVIPTSPYGLPPSFAVSLPKFHWAQQWFFQTPRKVNGEGVWIRRLY